MLELDEAHYRVLERLRGRGGAESDPAAEAAADPGFLALLRECKALVEEGEEERHQLAHHYERHALSFDSSHVGLTVCPTLKCNFRCPYCFEASQADGATMTAETVDRLIAFIASYKDARRLSLAWYGGEPTLAWEVIEDLTARVQALEIEYAGADEKFSAVNRAVGVTAVPIIPVNVWALGDIEGGEVTSVAVPASGVVLLLPM
jgi:uncharacterized protein